MNLEDLIAQEKANREEFEKIKAHLVFAGNQWGDEFYTKKIDHSSHVIYILEQYQELCNDYLEAQKGPMKLG